MRKLRYAVYDTETGKYLRVALLLGPHLRVTKWTRRPEKAQRFPGIKSAQSMVDALGDWNNIVILNARGVIVG